MSTPTLPGVVMQTITSSRITTRILFTGPEIGTPVLFLHGNVTSDTWWRR